MAAPASENDPTDSGADREARELEALAHGLARHARREQVAGKRPRAGAPSPKASAAAARGPAPASASAARAPAAAPGAAERAASAPTASVPTASARTTSAPTASAPTASAPTPARGIEDVRAQAKAARTLDELRAAVSVCRACSLCLTRTQTVFQDGEGGRGVLFVGEAPGADEDRKGVPFVGRSGQLLTDIIEKGMGIPRREVHIANVLKCRPPENRDPTPAEKEICTPWLDRQIELIDPKVIIPLGRHAAMHVLGVQAPMGALRQKVHDAGGRKVVPTFHPSYLLRSPGEKKACWQDIQLAMGLLGIEGPSRPSGG